jgi:hypothetical protein
MLCTSSKWSANSKKWLITGEKNDKPAIEIFVFEPVITSQFSNA